MDRDSSGPSGSTSPFPLSSSSFQKISSSEEEACGPIQSIPLERKMPSLWSQVDPNIAGPSHKKTLAECQIESIQASRPILTREPLPERIPECFKDYEQAFINLRFFYEEGFDSEQKKIDCLLGINQTYNKLVETLLMLDQASKCSTASHEDLQILLAWKRVGLSSCPLDWATMPRVYNYMDREPTARKHAKAKRKNYYRENKYDRRSQKKANVFFPFWMKKTVNGLVLTQLVLDYWNFRNEGVNLAKKVKTMNTLFKKERQLYEWLLKFKAITESSTVGLSELQLKAVKLLLANADQAPNSIENLKQEQVFSWNTLPELAEMEARYPSGGESVVKEEVPLAAPVSKKPRFELSPSPESIPLSISEPEVDTLNRILINIDLLRDAGVEIEFDSPDEDTTDITPMELKYLGMTVACSLKTIIRKYTDPAKPWDKEQAKLQCSALGSLFDHLEGFCQYHQNQSIKDPLLAPCIGLCAARSDFQHFSEALATPEHSRAMTRLKTAVKAARASIDSILQDS